MHNAEELSVVKRNGKRVSYDRSRLERAVGAAFRDVYGDESLDDVVGGVTEAVENILRGRRARKTDVEKIQDFVEQQIMASGYLDAAKAYVIFRHNKQMLRNMRNVPDAAALADFLAISKYARYLPDHMRRETWEEAVKRVEDMHIRKFPELKDNIRKAFDHVRSRRGLAAGRHMQFAGVAIEKNNARGMNCSAAYMDKMERFSQTMFLLLSGCGVGLDLCFEQVEKLPRLAPGIDESDVLHYTIPDTIEGWADAVQELVRSCLKGYLVEFNYSEIRPKGSPLKTSGGRAPGHVPLRKALDNVRGVLYKALGRQLKPIECMDILCHVAGAVLAGGVRRSALLMLFSPDDGEMMNAKTGDWHRCNPQRARANISVRMVRDEINKGQLSRIISRIKEFGEPGFLLCDDHQMAVNPCFTGDMRLLTTRGRRSFKELYDEGGPVDVLADTRTSPEGSYDPSRKGTVARQASPVRMTARDQEVYELCTEGGRVVRATSYHKFVTPTGRRELKDLHKGDCVLVHPEEGDAGGDVDFLAGDPIFHSIQDVYCLTEPVGHMIIVEGFVTGQCGEAVIDPVADNGDTGWGFCNLTTVNGAVMRSERELKAAVHSAVVIGTLQATYTDFPYLGETTESIVRRDALLGVSITGIMDNPGLCLDPDIQRRMAEYAVEVNREYAGRLGINPAKRVCLVKPEGTGSKLLGSVSAGITPRWAPRYFNRIQCNRGEAPYKHFHRHNPHMCEASVYGDQDDVLTFCIQGPEGALTWGDLTALEMLENIRTTQSNWVHYGASEKEHSVSNTVLVGDAEWDGVVDYIWENRRDLAGITLMSRDEGRYQQAPLQSVETEEEEIKWNYIIENYTAVDYTEMVEAEDGTVLNQTVECDGAACVLK